MSKVKNQSMNIAMLGLFSAIVVVLQSLSYVIKIGTFNLSLVLIPVVLGAVMFGKNFGSVIGGVFGVVTAIACIIGVDAGGHILFQSSPVLTILTCVVKGVMAGFVAGYISESLKIKNRYIVTIFAAIAAPIVNTGLFVIAMFVFFKGALYVWSGDTNVLYFALFGLVGVNFLIEFLVNAIFSPVIYRIVNALKKLV